MGGHDPISSETWLGSERPLARRVGRPIQRFMAIEAASGVLLIIATVVALLWANSPWKDAYHDLWATEVRIEVGDVIGLEEHGDDHGAGAVAGDHGGSAGTDAGSGAGADGDRPLSLGLFVNDALMALFFFVVGLEIKRELVTGELRNPRAAMLPAVAALGGMVVPALIYTIVNVGGDASGGWGIPMATDIAFAVGVLSLLGSRVPTGLKIFLLTLAIVDDLGAIVVIAVFYTAELSFGWLGMAAVLVALIAVMKRARIWYVPSYLLVGLALWYAVFQSGVHATIAGVILGLMAPARPLFPRQTPREALAPVLDSPEPSVADVKRAAFHVNESISVAERLSGMLHPFTSFVVIPLFALANAGIELSGDTVRDALGAAPTIGVFLGLLVGKLVGVSVFTMATVKLGLAPLPSGARPAHVVAVGALAGIGFTVALFVTGLSFDDAALQDQAKMGILAASAVASVVGLLLMRSATRDRAVHPSGDADEPRLVASR
jgi:Na+:H+ antiporter, NhaA family